MNNIRFRLVDDISTQYLKIRKNLVDRHKYTILLGEDDYQEFFASRMSIPTIAEDNIVEVTLGDFKVWGSPVEEDLNIPKGFFELKFNS